MQDAPSILAELIQRAGSFNLELTRSDMALIRKAVNENWRIPTEARKELARRIRAIVADGSKAERVRSAASRTLAVLESTPEQTQS